MSLLIKRIDEINSMPRLYENWDEYWNRSFLYPRKIEVSENPMDSDTIANALEDANNYPEWNTLEKEYMKDYSGVMLHQAIKGHSRGIMDCDPDEPAEFDLPDAETFKYDLTIEWANQFLKNISNKLPHEMRNTDIYSLDINDKQRKQILKKAESSRKWPDNQDIIEEYGKYNRDVY